MTSLRGRLRHPVLVQSVRFTDDGTQLITSSKYGQLLRFWSTETGKPESTPLKGSFEDTIPGTELFLTSNIPKHDLTATDFLFQAMSFHQMEDGELAKR